MKGEKMTKTKKRRKKGEGSLRQRIDGRWEGRKPRERDPITGKRLYAYFYGDTKREVEAKMCQVFHDAIEIVTPNGRFVKVEYAQFYDTRICFGEWLDTWLTEYKQDSVAPSTYDSYRVIVKHHLKPGLGKIPLARITTDQIQNLLNSKSKDGARRDNRRGGLSPSSILKIKIIISASIKQAVKNRLIPYNPADGVTPPRISSKEIRFFTIEEQKQFLQALEGHRLKALFTLALATGMRKGELLALTWDCYNKDDATIYVTKSVGKVWDPKAEKYIRLIGTTKTKSGMRMIPVLPQVATILESHRETQNIERQIARESYEDKNLIFCKADGTYMEPTSVNKDLFLLTKRVDIKQINFHALRHTFATRALEADIPARVVQEVLGHSDVAFTLNRYTHVLMPTVISQMGKMEKYIS